MPGKVRRGATVLPPRLSNHLLLRFVSLDGRVIWVPLSPIQALSRPAPFFVSAVSPFFPPPSFPHLPDKVASDVDSPFPPSLPTASCRFSKSRNRSFSFFRHVYLGSCVPVLFPHSLRRRIYHVFLRPSPHPFFPICDSSPSRPTNRHPPLPSSSPYAILFVVKDDLLSL